MSGGINHIKAIVFAVSGMINHTDTLGLDGNAAFPLDVHIVQHLLLHFSIGKCPCFFYNSIGQCTLAMINVRYNTKIPNVILLDFSH